MRPTSKRLMSLLPAAGFLLSASATAQEDVLELEDVSLSADFRPDSLHDSNAAVSVVDEFAIEERGALHLESILNVAPNLNFAGGTSRARFVQIRGIGERSQFREPVDPSVGVIVDGIDLSGLGGAATLFDVEQVEVLRGPQGTRYGASALAGMISVNSMAPTEEAEGYSVLGVGSQGRWQAGTVFSGPLTDAVQGRVALHKTVSDGDMENRFLDRDDTQDVDELTARAKLHWDASDDLSFDLTVLRLDADNGYDAFTLDNTRNTLADEPGEDIQETTAVGLRADWRLSSATRLQTTLSGSDSETVYSFDVDWVYDGFHEDGYSDFDEYIRDHQRASLDVRLLSEPDGKILGGTTDWVAGLYTRTNEEALTRNYTYLDGPFTSDYETVISAAYGQLDTQLSPRVSVQTGMRVERWSADYSDSASVDLDNDETLYGGKLGLTFALNPEHRFIASLARGYKAGGINSDGTLEARFREFDTEYLWNLEAGWRASLSGGRLLSRVTAFHTWRKDQQVQGAFQELRDDGSTEWLDYIDNAAEGKNIGLEAELEWLATDRVQLFASLGLLDATIDEYFAPATQRDPDGLELGNRDQAHAPNWQYALSARWRLAESWHLQAGVEGRDGFYFSDRHNMRSDAYSLLNASLSYEQRAWRVTLWGRNLLDEDYTIRGFGSFGNDPRNGYAPGEYAQAGEARAYGVDVRFSY